MILTHNQIAIRDWQLEDLETERYWKQPHHQWHLTDGPYYPKSTIEEIDSYIERLHQFIESNSFPDPRNRLPIIHLESNQLIGTVSCYWESIETNWLCIGVAIYDPQYWNRNIGYEALNLWCTYLFNSNLNLVRLDLRTWSGNLGMMRLAEKLGFSKEAVFRKARIVNGEYYDSIGYGILKEEWLSLT